MNKKINSTNHYQIAGAPDGIEPFIISALAEGRALTDLWSKAEPTQSHPHSPRDVIFVARDDVHMARISETLKFFAPTIHVHTFPAWDCLPYDRVSPRADIIGQRIQTLTQLLDDQKSPQKSPQKIPKNKPGKVLLTTVSAILQRVPPREAFADATMEIVLNQRLDPKILIKFLNHHGYGRAETVMEPGEYAVRGGIFDVFPSGCDTPFRLDFFGDELETIRAFDPTTQRTTHQAQSLVFKPISEINLNEASISRFRSAIIWCRCERRPAL
jgi:transcription-repair coupling factor (superfamily II helicase)